MYGMNLIRRASDTAMSRGSPELFPDLFGPFLASIDTLKSGNSLILGQNLGQNYSFNPKKCVEGAFELLKSLLRVA